MRRQNTNIGAGQKAGDICTGAREKHAVFDLELCGKFLQAICIVGGSVTDKQEPPIGLPLGLNFSCAVQKIDMALVRDQIGDRDYDDFVIAPAFVWFVPRRDPQM